MCRFTKLNRTVWEQVESLVYYFLFPVLLFHSIVKSPLDLSAASSLVGAAVSLALCAIALTYSLPHWPWLGRRIDVRLHAASAQVGFRFNSFILLAIADRVAGPQGLLMVAVIIGFCVPIFNIGAVWPMARHANKGFARELVRNPLIIACAVGSLLAALNIEIPPLLDLTIDLLGQGTIALGLLAAGAGMDIAALGRSGLKTVTWSLVRLIGLPVLAIGGALLLGISGTPLAIAVISSSVPTATSSYILARQLGGDAPLAANLIAMQTVLSLITMPVIWFACLSLGLF